MSTSCMRLSPRYIHQDNMVVEKIGPIPENPQFKGIGLIFLALKI